jgi:hypothetical protein
VERGLVAPALGHGRRQRRRASNGRRRTGADFGRAIDLLREKYPQYRTMDLRTDGAVLRLRAERIRAWRASD